MRAASAPPPHQQAVIVLQLRNLERQTKAILPVFGARPLTSIKPADVRAFIAAKLNGAACRQHERPAPDCHDCTAPLARNTVKNIAATLRAILSQAQVDELIPVNPAARFGKLLDARHDAREHVVALEEADVAHVLGTAAKWYPDQEIAVTALFYTGMREGELLGLQWDDFDFRRGTVDLRRTVGVRKGQLIVNRPKSGKLRTVDLPSALASRLRELKSVR